MGEPEISDKLADEYGGSLIHNALGINGIRENEGQNEPSIAQPLLAGWKWKNRRNRHLPTYPTWGTLPPTVGARESTGRGAQNRHFRQEYAIKNLHYAPNVGYSGKRFRGNLDPKAPTSAPKYLPGGKMGK